MRTIERLVGVSRLALLAPFSLAARRSGQRLFLAGGFLRDRFSGRRPRAELDLTAADPGRLVAAAGRGTEGSSFLLDRERETWRIAFPEGAALEHIDISRLRGASIAEDLAARDFTVNALAVDVTAGRGAAVLIDPLGGLADLGKGLLRTCSPGSFDDDPLRVLRGFRLASTHSLRMERATLALAKSAAAALARVSGERIRQELFAILQGPDPRGGMSAIVSRGILRNLSPAFADPEPRPLKIMAGASSLLDSFSAGSRIVYRTGLPLEQDVTGRGLLLLGAFLRDRGGADDGPSLAGVLRLGKRAAWILRTVAAAELPSRSLKNPAAANTAELYDMHRRYDACFEVLLLLEAAAKLHQGNRKGAVVALLTRYGRARKRFSAPPLLTGEAVMEAFGLSPGKELGELLRQLKQGQDLGLFRNREGALAWADRILKKDAGAGTIPDRR